MKTKGILPTKSEETKSEVNSMKKVSDTIIRLFMALLLLCGSVGMRATDYVIVYQNNFLSYNNGIANSTSFVPNTCIWTCYNGNNTASLGTSNTSLYSLRNGTNNYLNGSTTNGGEISRSNSAKNYWRTDADGHLIYRNSSNYSAYYRGDSWRTSSQGEPSYQNRNSVNYYMGYNQNPDYRATVYEVTKGDKVSAGVSDFEITGDSYISKTTTYSHTNAMSLPEYTPYTFNETTYYSTDDSKAASTELSGTPITTGYTWSLSANATGYATVNNSGTITVNSIPEEDIDIVLSCTVQGKTATKTITLTKSAPVAAGYVIYDGDGHYLGGTGTTAITSFNPNTCLWTLNNNKFQNSGNYLRLNRSGRSGSYTYSLNVSGTNSQNTITLSGSESGTTGSKIQVAYSGSVSRYVRYSNSWTIADSEGSSGTNVVFAVKQRHVDGSTPTLPVINTPTRNGNTISFTHTNIEGKFAQEYDDYIFYDNTDHYWYNNELQESAPAAPRSDWSGATYRWSIVEGGNYAQINATTGELTFKNAMPNAKTNLTVRLTTSNLSPMQDQTVDYTYTLTPSEESLTAPTIAGDGFIQNTGTYNYTASGSTHSPSYIRVEGSEGTYYVQGTAVYDMPSAGEATYTYALSNNSGFATINSSTGVITVTNIPNTGSQKMTLTVTARAGSLTKTVTKDIYLTKDNQITETGQYVITNSGVNFLGGTSTAVINSFDPATCLWTGTSGGTWQNSAGGYLYNNNTVISTTNSSNWTLGGTESRTTGQTIASGSYYIRYYNSAWSRSTSTYQGTRTVVFAVTKTTYKATNTDPAISGDETISAIGENSSFRVTQPAASYEDYVDYVFYNNTDHYFDLSGNSLTSPAVNFTNTWSLTYENGTAIPSDYATIDNNGKITYKQSFDADTKVIVKLTARAAGLADRVATQEVTFKEMPKFWFTVKMAASPAGGGTVTVKNASNAQVGEYTFFQRATSLDATSTKATVSIVATPSSSDYRWQSWAGVTITGTPAASATGEVTSTSKDEAHPTEITVTANFEHKPIFWVQAEAIADPDAGGTVAAKIGTEEGATLKTSAQEEFDRNSHEFTITYSVKGITDGYIFDSWYDEKGITQSTSQTCQIKVTSTSKDESKPTVKKLYAKFTTIPTSITVADLLVGVGAENSKGLVVTLLPEGSVRYLRYAIEGGENNEFAFIDTEIGLVTGKKPGKTTATVTAYKDAGFKEIACSCVANITVKDLCATPVITFNPLPDDPTKAMASITCATEGATVYYQLVKNGETRGSEWTEFTAPFEVDNLDKVYAKAEHKTDESYGPSKEAVQQYTTHKVATPTINITSTGDVTFECADEPDVIYYYTLDGSEPNQSNYSWKQGDPAISGLPNETQVTVVATKSGSQNSDIVNKGVYYSGVFDDIVYLNDYEDHTWTYYAGVDASVDGGNYNTNYMGILYSPEPRNVKIHYKGVDLAGALNANVAVSATESANQFVYYKTIEKIDGKYTYQVISNPFSKRPKSGSTYYGFAGWKIVSGGNYISGKADGETLGLDETVTLENLSYPSVNCTSAEIVLEATWATATVKTGTSQPSFGGGTYETNFWVLSGNVSSNVTLNQNMTVSAYNPDGTQNGNYGISSAIAVSNSFTGTVKLEYMNITGNGAIDAAGRNLTIGRGIGGSSTRTIYGCNTSNSTINEMLKVESGIYNQYLGYSQTPSTHTKHMVVFGNDYDRAKGNNDNLTINNNIYGVNSSQVNVNTNASNYTKELYHILVKSGKFIPNASKTDATYSNSFYMLDYNRNNYGLRILEVEGGVISHIAGGANKRSADHQDEVNFIVRMKGGLVNGSIFGGAAQYDADGSKVFVLTGGTVVGWIAGGSNGGASSGSGELNGSIYGKSYIYVGGNAVVGTSESQKINMSMGGYVFGAGCGRGTAYDIGKVTDGTNVVLADDAYVKYGIYGGGAYGYCGNGNETNSVSNIYITGGTVDGEYDNEYKVPGGVYGGARQNKGGYANIYMTGGVVKGDATHGSGIYGGSNVAGNMARDVRIVIAGGQVGDESNYANVHGGGYGNETCVLGSVNLAVGSRNATTGNVSGDAVIYGDVYGGSAQGKVNGNTSRTSGATTTVTLNSGTINGSLYGGGLGNDTYEADVYGPVQVTVHGGSVKGEGNAIYGCNNVNGTPRSTVAVDIWNTDPAEVEDDYAISAVFGGGNRANYNGKPSVTVHNCENSIEYVYGGGNAATVTGTEVLIEGGNTIGNVFGGGYGANVNGDIDLTITGGQIINVYGGNNNSGAVTGKINITVAQGEPNCPEKTEHAAGGGCPINITKLCGGGNMAASNVANIDIGCCDHIGTVYGGAEAANMTGDIDLNIKAGNIGTVFGGNNQSGIINGDITVTVNWDKDKYPCESSLGTVYGGGNLAEYDNGMTTVNILNCEMTGSVFGGGKGTRENGTGAHIIGNTNVNVGDWLPAHSVKIGGSVFGGGDEATVEGKSTVVIRDCATEIAGDVYGGGNAANIYETDVTVWGGSIGGSVFGGGNGADESKPAANVGYNRSNKREPLATGDATTKIYGGSIGVVTDAEYEEGTGGVFGGSNMRGDIKHDISILIDQNVEPTSDVPAGWGTPTSCTLYVNEAYGAGNQADFYGEGLTFQLGCVDTFNEIYGGAKNADLTADVDLIITSGMFNKVFGGNNIGGNLNGSITVTIDETGCKPIRIGELYGCGNQAAYSIYGYDEDGNVMTAGDYPKDNPRVNIISCSEIGKVFGGGYGAKAVVVGNPTVNIQQVAGKYDPDVKSPDSNGAYTANPDGKLGAIGTVYGGGNQADVRGNTNVNIGNTVAILRADGTTSVSGKGANITGNVYGGGNNANVSGKTHVEIGK